MGLDKLKKKPHQLVSKKKDGKRPGYRGRTDADTMSGSGYGAGSSSSSSDSGGNGGGYDYEYVAYNPPAPAPEPEPEYDTADFAFTTPSPSPQPDISEDDFVNPLDEFGIKGNVYADTVYDDGDKGDSLYVSPTLKTKAREPYIDYRPGPNYVTAQQLSNLNRGLGDSDEQAATLAKIQAVNPIQRTGFFDSGIGKFAKNVGKGLLTLAAPQIGGLAFGKTGYNAVNLGLKGKRAYDLAKRFAPNKTRDITTAFAKYNKNPGTGFEKSTFESDGDNRPIPKDVITASVQKYSPNYVNRAIQYRSKLLEGVEKGRVLSKMGEQTLAGLNQLIEQYQAKLPETMSV